LSVSVLIPYKFYYSRFYLSQVGAIQGYYIISDF